jgi:hypothetical protein
MPITRKQLEIAVERAGATMADILLNLVSRQLSLDMAAMDDARREWDRAIGDLHQARHLGATEPVQAIASAEPVALTDEQINEIHHNLMVSHELGDESFKIAFARRIESHLKGAGNASD